MATNSGRGGLDHGWQKISRLVTVMPKLTPLLVWFLAVVVTLALIAYWAFQLRNFKTLAPKRQRKSYYIRAVLMMAALGGGVFRLVVLLIPEEGSAIARALFGTLAIVAIGIALFVLKLRCLKLYACLEIVLAVILAASTMAGLKEVVQPVQMLACLNSLYFLIRGFDNFKKDRDEHAKEAMPATASSN